MGVATDVAEEAVVGGVDLVFEEDAVWVWHDVVISLFHLLIEVWGQTVDVFSKPLGLEAEALIAPRGWGVRHNVIQK